MLSLYGEWTLMCPQCPAEEELSLQGESGESNPGAVNFVAHIQSDQQRRQRFHDARILQLPAIQCPRSGNLTDQFECHLLGLLIVAANQNVAIDRFIAGEQRSAKILKRCG